MEITAVVYEYYALSTVALVLINVIIFGGAIWLLLEITKSAVKFYDYLKSRKKNNEDLGIQQAAVHEEGGDNDG